MNLQGVNYRVGIDKTVIGLSYPNVTEAQLKLLDESKVNKLKQMQNTFVAAKMHLINMIECTENFVKITNYKFLTRYLIKANDGTIACEVYLGKTGKTHVINIQFNPSKITRLGKAEFDSLLAVSFNHHYSEIYNQGRVSHIELNVDILDIDMSEYQLIDLGRRKLTNVDTTQYNGRRNSSRVMASYDKAKQLGTDDSIWRFEIRMKDRSRTVKEFIANPPSNPFLDFVLIKKSDLQSIAQESGFPLLRQTIKKNGFYGAVKNKAARDNISKRIRNKRANFWDVELFWEELRKELCNLSPNVFFKGTYT